MLGISDAALLLSVTTPRVIYCAKQYRSFRRLESHGYVRFRSTIRKNIRHPTVKLLEHGFVAMKLSFSAMTNEQAEEAVDKAKTFQCDADRKWILNWTGPRKEGLKPFGHK